MAKYRIRPGLRHKTNHKKICLDDCYPWDPGPIIKKIHQSGSGPVPMTRKNIMVNIGTCPDD